MKNEKKIKFPNLYGVDVGGTTMVMEEKEFFAYRKALKDEKNKTGNSLKKEKTNV